MKLDIDQDWFARRAALEGDLEIGAGVRKYLGIETFDDIVKETSDAFGHRLRDIMKGSSMSRNIHAFTAPGGSYPEYISVNQSGHDGYSVTVRSPRKDDGSEGSQATITIDSDQARALALAVLQDVTTEAG